MPTRCKIKIKDNNIVRSKIDTLYKKLDQRQATQWALTIASRIADLTHIDIEHNEVLKEWLQVNTSWQEWKSNMHQVRQSAFAIHALARNADSELHKNALRTLGQAVSSGHMKEHAMITSDYAIKTVGILKDYNEDAITQERLLQIKEIEDLNNIKK